MSKSIHHHLGGRERRSLRVRKRIFGTAERPRLSVFRSARHIYAQVIDDVRGVTLAAACSQTYPAAAAPVAAPDGDAAKPTGKAAVASGVGAQLARACLDQSITQVVFDRNGYRYHGRVQAVAEAARAAGLTF